MTTDYVENYYEDTSKLVETLVIKSAVTADRLNEWVVAKFGAALFDSLNPATWRYYTNIAGEYHYSNEAMKVISYDTLEEIYFTKANLVTHKATSEAYQYGTRAYKTLVNKYPEQEMLILGILYPADKQAAIEADDHSILSYPSNLIEPQEVTLISELGEWIKRYTSRWNVTGFNETDSLFPAAQFAVLTCNIYPRLLNMRLERCKTPEAHSFHIREYLASHGGLDKYIQYMTLEQKLFLYRNIEYIEHNAGTKANFDWLVENLLSKRNIPISSYSVRHKSEFDDSYLPEYKIRRKPINTQYNVREQVEFTLAEIFSEEETSASWNSIYAAEHKDKIDSTLKRSLSSVIQTKNFESITVNYSNTMKINFTDVALAHWIYMAANGLYPAVINFKHPRTGEMIALTATEAYTYFFYMLTRANGFILDTIPEFPASSVSRMPKVVISELTCVADDTYVDSEEIATLLMTNQPYLKKCVSKSAFHSLAYSIFQAHQYQWFLTAKEEHMFSRAIVEKMCKQMYFDTTVKTADYGVSYSKWLKARDLDDGSDFTTDEFNEIVESMFTNASGQDTDPAVVFRAMHSAMVAILSKLSSYSIQILHDSTNKAVIPLNWAMIRLGDYVKDSTSSLFIENHVTIYNGGTEFNGTGTVTDLPPVEVVDDSRTTDSVFTVDSGLEVVRQSHNSIDTFVPTCSFVGNTDHPKLSYWFNLPSELKDNFPDFY